MSQSSIQKSRTNDPCDYRYIASTENGFKHKKAVELIDYLPDVLSTKSRTRHSGDRINGSKYLKDEDIKNEDVYIDIPSKINLNKNSNVIFELGTVDSGSKESVYRVCVRMKNTPVNVVNSDNDYSNYEYCFVIQINNPEKPYSSSTSLITVYLNDKNDWHTTLNNSNYNDKNNIKVTII